MQCFCNEAKKKKKKKISSRWRWSSTAPCCHWEKPCWAPSLAAPPPEFSRVASQRNALGCGAAAAVGNNNSRIMDSNDPYLHISKYRAVSPSCALSLQLRICFTPTVSWRLRAETTTTARVDFTQTTPARAAARGLL